MTENEFIGIGFRIVSHLSSRTNAPHVFRCGVSLCTAETHMIELIGENHGISATGLCEALGVTKGAVSQIMKKLTDKGLVERAATKENGFVALKLTPLGTQVFEEHREMHIRLMQELYGEVEALPQEQRDAVHRFIRREEELTERLLER